jgi:hypothetical protein
MLCLRRSQTNKVGDALRTRARATAIKDAVLGKTSVGQAIRGGAAAVLGEEVVRHALK